MSFNYFLYLYFVRYFSATYSSDARMGFVWCVSSFIFCSALISFFVRDFRRTCSGEFVIPKVLAIAIMKSSILCLFIEFYVEIIYCIGTTLL